MLRAIWYMLRITSGGKKFVKKSGLSLKVDSRVGGLLNLFVMVSSNYR